MAARKKTKGWWDRCVAAVNRGARGVYDPEAVCGALLRDKRRAGIPEGGRAARGASRGRGGGSAGRGRARGRGCGCAH